MASNMTTTTDSKKSYIQLEVENNYLQQQNDHLNKELNFSRYTINALKGITTQKEVQINEARQELEKALDHIQLLNFTLKKQQQQYQQLQQQFQLQQYQLQQQQQQQRQLQHHLSGIGLIHDYNELSDDQSEEDDILYQQQEEEEERVVAATATNQKRRPLDIMTKLPLRQSPTIVAADDLFSTHQDPYCI